MISDFVKGKARFDFPTGIQQGIQLHRAIDQFTDQHEMTRQAKEVFRPYYRLYSGAIVDVLYDHFLATDPEEFNAASLFDFTQETYQQLELHRDWHPERFARMFSYMRDQNWLYGYSELPGIRQSLGGLVRRSAYLTDSQTAFELFREHYQLLQACYRQFWTSLKVFAQQKLSEIQATGNQPLQ